MGDTRLRGDHRPRRVKIEGGIGLPLRLCENGTCTVGERIADPRIEALVGQNLTLSLGHPHADPADAHVRELKFNGRAISLSAGSGVAAGVTITNSSIDKSGNKPAAPQVTLDDCATACLRKVECHSFISYHNNSCTLLRMHDFPWHFQLDGVQQYRKRKVDPTTLLGTGPCVCGGKLPNRYMFRNISNEQTCASMCTRSLGCIGIYTAFKHYKWTKPNPDYPKLNTGYSEGCFVCTSHTLDMLSATKPAVFVKGEDEAAQCTMVTASGPTKLEKAAGLAIDPKTLQCRVPLETAMSESGIDFSYVTPVTEHPHQLGTEAVLRGGG